MMKRTVSLAVIAAAVLSVGLLGTAQAEVRVGANYKLDSDPSAFRARDMPGIAVSRANPQIVVAINANYLDLTCEASRSTDGGETWSRAVALLPPDGHEQRCAFHQSVQFGAGQNVYAIGTAAKTTTSFGDASTVVYKSTDGGQTWQQGIVVMEGGPGTNDPVSAPSPGPNYSRPSLAVDPGTAGAPDRVYAVSRDFRGFGNNGTAPACTATCAVVKVAASADSGATFSAPVNASPVGVSAQDPPPSVVNSDGSITVAWRTLGVNGVLQAARSVDRGATWSAPVDIAKVRNTALNQTVATHLPPANPAQASTTATYPRMAADPTRPGRIYLVYGESPPGPAAPDGGFAGADHFINFDNQVYFQRSSDNGLTWSAAKLISDPTRHPGAETVQTRHPNVSVSPGGRVDVVWHDRRHWYQGPGERNCTHSHIFCEDVRLGDTYYSYSTDGGTGFSANIRISDRSHNNDVGYDTRPASGYWSWGPQAVTVGSDRVLIGWMDSREGNWDTDTEDVYLARVDLSVTGNVAQTTIGQADSVSGSVSLARRAYPAGNEGALVGGPRDPANAGLTAPPSIPGGPASRNASSVVIVKQDDVAAAMAATVLGRAFPGPVLLSPSSGLPASVKDEIARMRPADAYVIGDATSLSEQVVTDIGAAAGFVGPGQVVRLSGGNDAATAALIAARFDHRTTDEKDRDVPAFDAAVIANPATPDAAAAVGLAAARRLPILYVGADSIPSETTEALNSLDIKKALVIGGPSVVSAGVVTQLQALPKLTDGVQRLGGADQYETSKEVVAESKRRGLPSNVVYVADGSAPMDAALLSGVLARATGMLMLASTGTTAAGQASSFGLTGISRFIRLTPPPPPPLPPADTTPPATPPAAAPPAAPPAAISAPPAAAGDRTAPTVRLSLRGRQRLGSTVKIKVLCPSEACTAVVGATIRLAKLGRSRARTLRLKSVTARLARGASRMVSLKISKSRRSEISRRLKARKSVSAKVTVKVTDAAGNARTLRRTVRFTR